MAIKPRIRTLTNSSVDVLNAIRNSASNNYRNYVPVATADAESIRTIGAVIMDYPALQNEFLNALINRIGRVMLTSKMYDNPWAAFKRGMLEFGETIEEIFVDIAKPFEYDPAVAESKVFAREIPDVYSAFHIMNYQKFYKATIQQKNLRQAFLSWRGITDLIAKIVNAMYAGASYDEFLTMKYMLARHILDGHIKPVTISAVSAANAKSIVSKIKNVSNDLTFLNRNYNLAGVANYTDKNDQYIIVSSEFDAVMDVEVLAAAFNMDKAEFSGHRTLVDSFGNLDTDRLDVLFKDDDTYSKPSSAELAALDAIPAVLVDKDWFMIFDNLFEFTENFNGEGMYWNYWYHTWKTFSVSPFANAALFVPGTPGVTSVSITPEAITANAGQSYSFSATVVTTDFAPKTLNWTATDGSGDPIDGVTINGSGVLTIGPDVDEDGTVVITVKAASAFKPSVYDTATVTVGTAQGGET